MPDFPRNLKLPDGRMIDAAHPEYAAHAVRWRWLLDSLEGGEAYRLAAYGTDGRGYPVRNLVRHKREYPDPRTAAGAAADYIRVVGTDQYVAAVDDDDYQLRLARPPVPMFLAEVLDTHLSKIFSQEIDRTTSDKGIEGWWGDVDGTGTPIDRWMQDTVAPFLMTLGQLDLIFDHPATTEAVDTQADVKRLGLDTCVASYVLPENMVWWAVDRRGRYMECLVRECGDEDRYRYWNAAGWWLYDENGAQVSKGTHPFGVVPIVRVFDRRRPRCRHVGLPRYETIAELQREFYNRDSELILADTLQAHPLLQGPEDYVNPDGSIPIGPNWLLPKKKCSGTTTTYEGFDVIEFPKEGAKSIQENLDRIRDRVDRAALLTKPAGASGTSANSVSQSGTSKRMDNDSGNRLLASIAGVLESAERTCVEFVSLVLGDGKVAPDPSKLADVSYPREFDLIAADEFTAYVTDFQAILAGAGALPETEQEMLCRLLRMMLPGLSDEDYDEFDAEIETYLASKAVEHQQTREANLTMVKNEAANAGTDADSGDPAAS